MSEKVDADLIHQNGRIYVDLPVGGFFSLKAFILFTECENTQKTELEAQLKKEEIAHPQVKHREILNQNMTIMKTGLIRIISQFNYKVDTMVKMPENYSFEDSHPGF